MKLLALELAHFGAIASLRLELGARAQDGGEALHLVYGPNEAGKSTTLRALLALLFGVEHHSKDAKLFGGEALRVRGELLDAEGRRLTVVRRKGVKNTLLDERDEPIDEAALQRVLGHMPEAVFRTMFGLDHERLRQGGEQLRLGQGDLGESLFQAGAGMTGLHELLARLRQQADDLFRPRGQRKPLNQAIEEHAAARRSVREHVKHAEAARAQEQELAAARQQRLALQAERSALQEEQSRLARALRVLPKLAQRRELRERQRALGEVPRLPDDCEAQRQRARQEQLACADQIERLERTLERLARARGELVLPESLLELGADHVQAIRDQLGSHRKAQRDLPSRRAELRMLELEAEAALRALGGPVELTEVEALRVDRATQARVAKLAREHSGLLERVEAAERRLEAASAQLDKARVELEALPRLPGAEGARKEAQVLPSEAAVEAFRARFERIERARAQYEIAWQSLAEREERAQVQLDRMAREGAPPTEADLARARAARDALLPLIRTALSGEISAHPRLLLEFESLLQRADETADRLRREAGRVAELAQLQAELEASARERARRDERRAELRAEEERVAMEWQKVWEPLGIVPRAPLEMRPLLAKVSGLLEDGERGRSEAERRLREARAELARWQASWRELMGRLRLPEQASAEEAQAVLDELRRLFEKVDASAQLRTRIAAMERDAQEFTREVQALVGRHLPELAELPVDQAAEQLVRACERARQNFEQQQRIDREREEAEEQLSELRRRARVAEGVLAELMRLARAEDLEALERAEQRVRHARELERQLAAVEQDLVDQSDGQDVESLAEQAAALSPDRMRARLEAVREELERIDARREELDEQIVRLDLGLQTLRRDDLAAQDAIEAEQHLARIKSLAHAYVRKRLAATLLEREIRRYRDEHQAPIVKRASELFSRLTLARYPRLQVSYDARDEPVLACLDAHGRTVHVEALSDGARDQLYLALRLASLERFAAHNPPMPLVLDDVLIHFDDDRARAALKVLGEFAHVTQVLFFTHHKRLLELAREALPERLCEHRLTDERTPALPETADAL